MGKKNESLRLALFPFPTPHSPLPAQGGPRHDRTQNSVVVVGGFVARRAVELQRVAARRNAGAAGFAFAASLQARLQSLQPGAGCSDRPPIGPADSDRDADARRSGYRWLRRTTRRETGVESRRRKIPVSISSRSDA